MFTLLSNFIQLLYDVQNKEIHYLGLVFKLRCSGYSPIISNYFMTYKTKKFITLALGSNSVNFLCILAASSPLLPKYPAMYGTKKSRSNFCTSSIVWTRQFNDIAFTKTYHLEHVVHSSCKIMLEKYSKLDVFYAL